MRVYADVVAVEFVGRLLRVGVDHAHIATGAAQNPLQYRPVLVADLPAAGLGVESQPVLHRLPDSGIDDALVFSLVDLPAEVDLANVDHVGEQAVETILRELMTAGGGAHARGPRLHPPIAPIKF